MFLSRDTLFDDFMIANQELCLIHKRGVMHGELRKERVVLRNGIILSILRTEESNINGRVAGDASNQWSLVAESRAPGARRGRRESQKGPRRRQEPPWR